MIKDADTIGDKRDSLSVGAMWTQMAVAQSESAGSEKAKVAL